MRNIVILGSGTAGTMMANHLRREFSRDEWNITIVDKRDWHDYQPGYLFIPFEIYEPEDVRKPIDKFLPKNIPFLNVEADRIVPEEDKIILMDGTELPYDILVIATGTDIAPQETEGMLGPHWQESVFDFYSYDGAVALRKKLKNWEGGHLVVNICEMPIKCPVDPLENPRLRRFSATCLRKKE
jgi:sulfide:quinone oxidoreductase